MQSELIQKLLECLDYVLDKDQSDEIALEVTFKGAVYQTDERGDLDEDENPGGMFDEEYLGDMENLTLAEFSSADDFPGIRFDRRDLEDLRRRLSSTPADWRSMDSAPRDGTNILVTGLDGGIGPKRHVMIARWEQCPNFGGHFTDSKSGSKSLDFLAHWQPIPFLPGQPDVLQKTDNRNTSPE